MNESLVGPTSHYFYSQRLKLHYVDWGNHGMPTLVLVHGGRDHSRSWDWVAQALRRDWHVVAPDLRGHGDSQWSIGGNYSMIDYTLDLAQLLEAVDRLPVTIIGHSLGGAISLQYAGCFPGQVQKVVAIEGLGPPPGMLEESPAPKRMRDWIAEMQKLARRHPRRYATLDEAVTRMQSANPNLNVEQARHLTVHGCYRAADGMWLWKFDNFVRSASPYLFNMAEARQIWAEIICPVLLLRGADSWAGDPLTDGRGEVFRNSTVVNVERAGHWVHHDQLGIFLEAVGKFLGSGL